MITFKKIKYSTLPLIIQKAILSWSDEEIIINETLLTPTQQTKLIEFLNQEGYKMI